MMSGRLALQATRLAASRASIAPRSAVRYYAQPAGQSSKPPVALFGVDGTYASALYTAASKSSAVDSIAKSLENLAAALKKDAGLSKVLSAPTLSAPEKKQLVTELQKQVGTQDKGDLIKNFLDTLAENNRLGVLEQVCEKFAVLMSAHRGEVELVVTSAAPLDSKVLRNLEAAVSKSQYVGQGKKLKVVPKVNPEIRGGLIVEIGDRTIDLSVSSKMAKLNKLLKDAL